MRMSGRSWSCRCSGHGRGRIGHREASVGCGARRCPWPASWFLASVFRERSTRPHDRRFQMHRRVGRPLSPAHARLGVDAGRLTRTTWMPERRPWPAAVIQQRPGKQVWRVSAVGGVPLAAWQCSARAATRRALASLQPYRSCSRSDHRQGACGVFRDARQAARGGQTPRSIGARRRRWHCGDYCFWAQSYAPVPRTQQRSRGLERASVCGAKHAPIGPRRPGRILAESWTSTARAAARPAGAQVPNPRPPAAAWVGARPQRRRASQPAHHLPARRIRFGAASRRARDPTAQGARPDAHGRTSGQPGRSPVARSTTLVPCASARSRMARACCHGCPPRHGHRREPARKSNAVAGRGWRWRGAASG